MRDLKADKALCQEATGGPWIWESSIEKPEVWLATDARFNLNPGEVAWHILGGDNNPSENGWAIFHGTAGNGVLIPEVGDLNFAAAARTALPEYIAWVEQLLAENARLRDEDAKRLEQIKRYDSALKRLWKKYSGNSWVLRIVTGWIEANEKLQAENARLRDLVKYWQSIHGPKGDGFVPTMMEIVEPSDAYGVQPEYVVKHEKPTP